MTKIEWATETWNPIIGCSKVSEGCRNCYAERMAQRLANMGTRGYTDVIRVGPAGNFSRGWNCKTAFVKSALEKPLHWKKPRRIFVCSMGDLFHESVNIRGNETRSIFRVMASTDHTYMVLTKRPDRMATCINNLYEDFAEEMPNVWLGVTAENQQTADERIPVLLQIPAAVRFVSIEPMIGKIDLRCCPACGFPYTKGHDCELGGSNPEKHLRTIDWVICGGESGHNARPINPEWVRSLRDQCKEAGTPYFFKQWGEHLSEDYCMQNDINVNGGPDIYVHQHNENYYKVGKKAAGRLLDGETWDQIPEVQS